MNRSDFVKAVTAEKGISSRQAYNSVNAVMDTLRLLLSKGEKIEIGGFGTFEVLTDLHGVHIPTFKGGKALKRVLNTPVNSSLSASAFSAGGLNSFGTDIKKSFTSDFSVHVERKDEKKKKDKPVRGVALDVPAPKKNVKKPEIKEEYEYTEQETEYIHNRRRKYSPEAAYPSTLKCLSL